MRIQPWLKGLLSTILLAFGADVVAQALSNPPPPAVSDQEKTIKQIQSYSDLMALAQQFLSQKEYLSYAWTLERAVELRPYNGDLKYMLAGAYAQLGEKTKTYDLLLRMQGQGYAYYPADDARFSKVTGTEAYDYILANLKANAKPFGDGKVAHELAPADRLLESIAWDPKAKRILLGSARDGAVYALKKDGSLQTLISADANNGLMSVFDLAVDAKRGLLWVASSGVVHFKGFKQEHFGRAGVFKFDLKSGKFLKSYLLPIDGVPDILSNLTVGSDGRVYVVDGSHNAVYKLDGEQLKPLFTSPRLSSIRGLALSGDGRTLYFADYELGLFGVDLAKGQAFAVAHPASLVLGGIDGLYYYQGNLIAIQNGMVPQRVMRLKLAEDGLSISSVQALDAAQSAFDTPTLGAIAGDSLYFIANSQKRYYDTYGSPIDVAKLPPTRIYQSNLRFAWGSEKQRGNSQALVPIRSAAPAAATAVAPIGQTAPSSSAEPPEKK